jgi:pilus assembly protein CpaB
VSARRTLIIIVAIGIAAVAAVANVLYLNSVQDRANSHAKLLKVFVVARDVEKGATGESVIASGQVKSGSVPEQYRPATALTDINQIKGKVSLTGLAAGQVIVDGQFVEPIAAQVTFSQRIPTGQVAVAVALDGVKAVGGLLVPGDKVDMVVPGSPAAGSGGEAFLYQNVNILAIGSTAAPQPGETQAVSAGGGGIITFAVPPVAAEKILLAGAGITLVLVPPDNQAVPIAGVDATNLFTGGLTPYAG